MSIPPPSTPNGSRTPLLVALAVSCLARIGALVFLGDALGNDQHVGLGRDDDAYRVIATNLIERGAFSRTDASRTAEPTAFRPPLYPYLLSILCWGRSIDNLTVALFHLALGLGTVGATFAIARQWRLGCWPSSAAAILVGLDPLLLHQSTLVMTETLATFLAAWCALMLMIASRRNTVATVLLASFSLGIAVLCRPTFLVWVALIVVTLTFQRGSWRSRAVLAVALVTGVALLLAPWTIRNQRELNKPIVATTHGGYTFLLGNNRHFYAFLRAPRGRTVWDADELHANMPTIQSAGLNAGSTVHPEVLLDRLCYKQALTTIREQPTSFAYSCLVRVTRLWRPLPHQLETQESSRRRMLRYGTATWYSLLFCSALCGAWSRRSELFTPPMLVAILFCLSLTLVHTFFWSNIRMRAPATPFICCLAIIGVTYTGLLVRTHSSDA